MITTYLTEELLGRFIKERFINEKIHNQYKINKFRVDYFLETINLVIEFNGYRHYSESKNIERDNLLIKLCVDEHIKILFIPYFVQLDSLIIRYYFEHYQLYNYEDFNSYSHGFIDSKAMRPYDFCFQGLVRYFSELELLPNSISKQIRLTDNFKDLKLEQFIKQNYIKKEKENG